MAKGGFKGGYGGYGGGSASQLNMMKQAQKMQQELLKMQSELENTDFEFSSGGGAVKAVVSGTREFKSITINPEIIDGEDIEMLQDLILSAVNGALKASEQKTSESMSKIQSGLGGFPGMF